MSEMSESVEQPFPGGPRTPPGQFLVVGRHARPHPAMVKVEVSVDGPVDIRVPFELGFGEPGTERPVHVGSAPERAFVGTPLGGEELVSVRFPRGIPDAVVKVTTTVWFEPRTD